jgi:hypothetical protein
MLVLTSTLGSTISEVDEAAEEAAAVEEVTTAVEEAAGVVPQAARANIKVTEMAVADKTLLNFMFYPF